MVCIFIWVKRYVIVDVIGVFCVGYLFVRCCDIWGDIIKFIFFEMFMKIKFVFKEFMFLIGCLCGEVILGWLLLYLWLL